MRESIYFWPITRDIKLQNIWMNNFSISINVGLMYLELYIYINVDHIQLYTKFWSLSKE